MTINLNRLSEYGFGYLAGKVFLLIIVTVIMFTTREYIVKNKSELQKDLVSQGELHYEASHRIVSDTLA